MATLPSSLISTPKIRVRSSWICPDCDYCPGYPEYAMPVVELEPSGFWCPKCERTFRDQDYWLFITAKPDEIEQLGANATLALRLRELEQEIELRP